MRLFVTLAAAGLILAGCAQVNPPPVAEPAPVPAGLGDQNRFVPPPGGFQSWADAARESQMRSPPPGTTGAAGFVPMDDDGFAASFAAAAPAATGGPNVVDYALSTSHPVGTPRYRRSNPLRWQVWERNCMQFPSQDAAQEAFLAAGGPERDRRNLDPDGDGYACWWDPGPIRRAMRAG